MMREFRRIASALPTIAVLSLSAASAAKAGPREVAWKIFNRLNGVPPAPEVLDQMAALVGQGQIPQAAAIALESPYFYNLTLKDWVAPWTNADGTVRVELNDFTATVIGMVRDDVPFDEVLSGD